MPAGVRARRSATITDSARYEQPRRLSDRAGIALGRRGDRQLRHGRPGVLAERLLLQPLSTTIRTGIIGGVIAIL